MRAARLLDMLLILQHRGRMTARQLAGTLEVSERTVLRDVGALSEAGVPIYTTRGGRGGIELLDGFQSRLTGLTTDEALCLLLAGQPQVAHRLGLAAPARTARHKLLDAMPAAVAEQADRLPSWFLLDPDPWSGNQIPHGELRRIARCIHQRQEVELTFADQPAVTVSPVGLVLKAGSWQLVVVDAATARTLGLDTLRGTRITTRRFTPPPDFSLTDYWTEAGSRLPESWPGRSSR